MRLENIGITTVSHTLSYGDFRRQVKLGQSQLAILSWVRSLLDYYLPYLRGFRKMGSLHGMGFR